MRIWLPFLLCFTGIASFGQNISSDIYNLNFDQLSNLKVFTVSKTEQATEEVPATVRIITSNDIVEKGYFTFDEMLSDLPGFQFRNIQSLNSYVFQRGIPNQNNLILVLIDGIQVNELNSGGFYGGAQYDLESIDRVEVVYGPSSVTYGTNAISGIINIITKEAKETGSGLSVLTGNFKTYNANAHYSFINSDNTFRIRVAGMAKSSQKADLTGEAGDFNWTDLMDNSEDDYSFNLKASYNNFTFGTNYLNKQSSVAAFQKSVGTEYRDFGTNWNILFLNNYLRYSKQVSDKIDWSSVLYNRNATVLKNTVYLVTDSSQTGYYRPNNLTGFENIVNVTLTRKIAFTTGLLLEYEKLAESAVLTQSTSMFDAPSVPGNPNFQKNFLTSFFFEPRLNLVKNLFVSGGLRFDYSTFYDKVLTPRVGVNYNLGKLSSRISYAEAFRAPKPWDYYDGIGNVDLLPETMKAFEFGLKMNLTNNVVAGLVGYQNNLHNGLIKEFLNEGYRWTNGGVINTSGLEFDLDYSIQKLSANLNYTYIRSTNENGDLLPEISLHSANAGFTYRVNSHLGFNLRTNFMGERTNTKLIATTNSNVVDPYLIFNGAVTWLPYEPLTVQLVAKNILDAEYYHTSNRAPDRYRQAQRTILVKVAYKFYN